MDLYRLHVQFEKFKSLPSFRLKIALTKSIVENTYLDCYPIKPNTKIHVRKHSFIGSFPFLVLREPNLSQDHVCTEGYTLRMQAAFGIAASRHTTCAECCLTSVTKRHFTLHGRRVVSPTNIQSRINLFCKYSL